MVVDHIDQRRFDVSDTIMRQCTGMLRHARRVGGERMVVEHGGEHTGRGIARQQPQFEFALVCANSGLGFRR
jgi:hypothetical protein